MVPLADLQLMTHQAQIIKPEDSPSFELGYLSNSKLQKEETLLKINPKT